MNGGFVANARRPLRGWSATVADRPETDVQHDENALSHLPRAGHFGNGKAMVNPRVASKM